jgi:hypothetical protein
MKVKIIERCSVVCEVGSICEVTESQYKTLGGFAVPYAEKKADAPTEKKTTPKGGKKDRG